MRYDKRYDFPKKNTAPTRFPWVGGASPLEWLMGFSPLAGAHVLSRPTMTVVFPTL